VVVVQFLVGHGPVWKRLGDWDRAILWSYASVPFLIFAVLAIKRRLTFRAWLIHTVELAGYKFMTTAVILTVLLTTTQGLEGNRFVRRDETPRPDRAAPAHASSSERTFTPLPEGQSLSGRVMDEKGTAVSGAVVYLSGGAESVVVAPPGEPLELVHGPDGLSPRISVALRGQTLIIHSADKVLHTVRAIRANRRWAFNVPVLSGDHPTAVTLDTEPGLLGLHCTVHGEKEPSAQVLILQHPLYARTDAEGRFRLPAVPAGKLVVNAFGDGVAVSSHLIEVASGATAAVDVRVQRGP
jgi:hypothetical protein